jgi:ACS family hexuronate transporter-like MFS transporter
MTGSERSRWILCWLLFGATALSFLDRQVLSVLAPTLIADFHMDNTTYSRVVFAFVLSYTVMFSAGGWLMDRVGVRLGMALSVGLWSLASAAHAVVNGAWGLGAARFVLGLGEGGGFPGATKGAVEWFPLEKRVLAVGIATGGSAFGAVIAPPVTALLAGRFGWRGAFLATGIVGALWVVAWLVVWRWAPPAPSGEPGVRRASVPIRELLGNEQVRWVLVARFLFDPVFYFYMFWIPQYLSRERGFSLAEIGNWYWVPFLTLGVSQIGAGRVSDRLVARGWTPRRARMVLLTAAALVTPVSWLSAIAPSAGWAIGLMSLLLFAHGFWITNFLGLLSDLFPSRAIATVTGLSGTAGGTAGMISNLIVGPVVDRFSFMPVFAVSAFLYPLALVVLWAGTRARPSR